MLEAAKLAIDFARERYGDYDPEIRFQPDMPTGPVNRVASNTLARELMGWEPKVLLAEGIERTARWYFETKDQDEVKAHLSESLTER